jgi:autotransporter-associated beta strand protein
MKPQASHSSHQTATGCAAPRRARLRAVLLATSALATASLPTTVAAQALDATWAGVASGNYNFDGNWVGGQVATGTATFADASVHKAITFSAPNTLGGIIVMPGAGDYTFDTQGNNLTFNGLGLSVGSGATLTFTNSGIQSHTLFQGNSTAGGAHIIVTGGGVIFQNGSSADQARIDVSTNAQLSFQGDGAGHANSSAANATIVTSGNVFFDNASTAANAHIEVDADGAVVFSGQSTGGTASIVLAGGNLDIATEESGTTIGSLAGSGIVTLDNKALTVGSNDQTTSFGGSIDGPDGSLTKIGNGTLTLTGTHNSYTGATTVSGGALIVDGSIALSSGVDVAGGATLGGIGTVATTTLQEGAFLAPGHDDGHGVLTGKLTVAGDLTFAGTSIYSVQVTPTDNTSTSVTGTATLHGATVNANFTPGAFVPKQFAILTANDLTGKFGSLVTPGLSPMFTAALSYDPDNTKVFLTLSAVSSGGGSNPGSGGGSSGGGNPGSGGGLSFPGFNTNQNNVGNGIVNSFNLMSGLSYGAFLMLTTPQSVTQVSGETAVGTQQATFDAMNQFMSVLLDPTLGVRGGAPKDAMAAMPRKAAPLSVEAFDSRWGVWAAGFGGSQSTSGDNVLGSNKTTSNVFGSAVGVDYRFSPDTVAGFALAGGGTHFNVANGGSGNSDLFQAGAYVKHTEGAVFVAGALAYGWQDVTTNRNVSVFGIDSLRGNFKTNAISGRLEGGYRVATAVGDITPYAAGQFTSYRLPSYMEQVAFGAGTFALNYAGKDVTASRSELGLRGEKAVPMTDATLMLRGRLAWAHDFNTDRNVQATFQALPGSAFVVNGATPAADTALTTVAAEMLWRNGWSASATADAQLSDTTHSYSGKGVVRYSW